MKDQELKPCTFCGQTPEQEVLVINQGYDDPQWWIECQNHHCPVVPGLGDSCRETAKEQWNTRTPDPMLEELVRALQEVLKYAVILSEEYLSAFEDCSDDRCIQGWEKSRWQKALSAKRAAEKSIQKYQQSKVQP